MKGHGAKFSRKMEQAVAALLTHRNTEEAARAVGIGVATLQRWQKRPEFEAAYRKARRDAVSQTIGRLQQNSSAAGTILAKIMVDQNVAASTRVRAAECIINHALKGIELEDILERLSEIERLLGGSKSKDKG